MLTEKRGKVGDLAWGFARGTQLAFVFCIIAVAVAILRPQSFSANGVRLGDVLVVYLAMGIVGGAILGSMRSLLRQKRTAYIPAITIGTVGAFAGTILLEGWPAGWDSELWAVLPIAGAIFGVGGVYNFWEKPD